MQTIAWPFLAAEALAAESLTFRELRRFHTAVYPGVWAPREADISAVDRARAAWLWSRRRGVLAGLSASALLGAKWIEPDAAAELVHDNRRPPARIVVHADGLLSGENVTTRSHRPSPRRPGRRSTSGADLPSRRPCNGSTR